MSDNIDLKVSELRKRSHFVSYLAVRKAVLKMLEDEGARSGLAFSEYWKQEVAGFEYLFDATPLITEKLRHHCYHITGLKEYEYRPHHAHKAEAFVRKRERLKAHDARGLFVPENPELGGFGHVLDGQLVNIDTLKFYESLIAMDKAGLLPVQSAGSRPVVVEIGAGWGGFAYQFKTLFPDTTYVIIDLPQVILFSGLYLKEMFPNAKIYICLLYTSPSPRDATLSRMPSSA